MKFWQLLRIGGMKTKPKRKRKSLLRSLSLLHKHHGCQSWMLQEKRSSVGNADGYDVGRTTRACSRAGVVDLLYRSFRSMLACSARLAILLTPRVLTAQMRRRHLTAVPELAIALLFCCGTGRFSQCVYKREYYQSGTVHCPIGESASLFAQSLLVYPNAACLPHYE